MYAYLIVLTVCSTVGLQCWRTLFDNFSVNVVGLDGHHVGLLQSIREIPGFLALLVTYVLLVIKEHRLAALSILFLGAGIFFTGLLPSFTGLAVTTMVMSFGFHYYETCSQSLTLQYFDTLTSPLVFAEQQQFAAVASIFVGISIYFMAPFLSYNAMFIFFGSLIIGCGIWAFSRQPSKQTIVPQKKQMVIKKILALLFLDLYGRGKASDFYGFCGIFAGQTVWIFHPGCHPFVPDQQCD